MIYTCKYQSPLGEILLAANDDALIGLWIDTQIQKSAKIIGERYIDMETTILTKVKAWLDRYFAGKAAKPAGAGSKADGNSFCRKMYGSSCWRSPTARTTTYGEIAKQIATEREISQMSAQAVGNAVGSNPISIIIPCHRVIGASGNLVGYTGGLEKKIFLLKLEGHTL